MSRINSTINSHRYHDIRASSASPSHSIRWNAAPGREKWSGAWTEHRQWIALRFLTAPRITGGTGAETTSNEMVMGVVRALCEFSLLVSQQNHSDLSLKALDDALKRFYKKKGAFREQTMSTSVKAKVDEQLARESHQLWEQKIHKMSAAMEVQLYGAEKVTTTRQRQLHVLLNRARQAATIWSDADWQNAKERLELQIHQVTPGKHKLFDELFQHHKRQLLQEGGTKATGPRSIFAKTRSQMKTAAE